MVTHFLGWFLLLNIGVVGVAAAQHAASPGLVALEGAGAKATAANPAASFRPDSIFVNPEVRPQFVGGDAALRDYVVKNLHYPELARRQHVTGKVLVRFVLSATGRITDASVVRGPGGGLNEEALRLVWLMPAWQPARQQGQPVRVGCTMPINFEE